MAMISLAVFCFSGLALAETRESDSAPGPRAAGDLQFPSRDGVVINPAGTLFNGEGYTGLSFFAWRQATQGGLRGDVGASLDSRNYIAALSIVSQDLGPGTLGARLGLSVADETRNASGKLGLLTDDGEALQYPLDYRSNSSTRDLRILFGARPLDNLSIAAQLIASAQHAKSTAGQATVRDGSIQYSQVQWSAAWRVPGTEAHEIGITYRPKVQRDEGADGSIEQERVVKIGYSRALPQTFPYMSAGLALSWHDYYRIDHRLDTKASYDFSVEKLYDDDLFGLDWSWQPAFYGTADSVSPASVGQSLLGLRHTRRWQFAEGRVVDSTLGLVYGPRVSRSESDNGKTWDGTAGAIHGIRLGARYFF